MPNYTIANRAQPAPFDHVIDSFLAFVTAHLPKPAAEVEVLGDLHLQVQWDIFREIAKVGTNLAGLVEDVKAVNRCPATGWRQVAGQHAEGGRLAGAVGPKEANDLPFRHF